MTYEFLGFTFIFNQDENGFVTSIQTPTINVGVFSVQSYVLNLAPGTTVAQAEAIVQGILGLLGIS